MNITLSQALLGPDGGGEITKEVNQLDGRRIAVTLPAGVSNRLVEHLGAADFAADRSTRSRNENSRRRHARFKSRIRQKEGRSHCQVECHLPKHNLAGAKARITESPRLESVVE